MLYQWNFRDYTYRTKKSREDTCVSGIQANGAHVSLELEPPSKGYGLFRGSGVSKELCSPPQPIEAGKRWFLQPFKQDPKPGNPNYHKR